MSANNMPEKIKPTRLMQTVLVTLLSLFTVLTFLIMSYLSPASAQAAQTETTAKQLTKAKFIPTGKEYHQFLLETWQDDKPSVLVFADPFCPYCIRAIPKIATLKDYNVFFFWSAILGQRSIDRVNDIFHCQQPISTNILNAVQSRQSPQCSGDTNTASFQLNKKVVDSYSIAAVPSYFLQGKRVSLSHLLTNSQYRPRVNGVAVNWQRFALMKAYNRPTNKSMALVIPAKFTNEVENIVAEKRPEYLFLENDLILKYPQLLQCQKHNDACIKKQTLRYKNKLAEFKLMFASPFPTDKIIMIDSNGVVVPI